MYGLKCITKPEFAAEQFVECKKCKHASAKIKWCGKHGCQIGEDSRIIVPKNYPSLPSMAGGFVVAIGKQMLAGNPKRTEEELKRIKVICEGSITTEKCEFFMSDTKRCLKCGCCMRKKYPWATTSCKLGKW